MNAIATELFWMLGRTTLWLSLVGLATAIILRLARTNWPTAHRLGWTLVLLVGWAFLSLSVAIPWYDAPSIPASVPTESIPEPTPIELMPADTVAVDQDIVGPIADDPISTETSIAAIPSHSSAIPEATSGWPDWRLVVVSLWLLGIVALGAAWLVGYARFVRSLPCSREVDPTWQDQWTDLLSAAGVRRSIPLRITAQLGPMLCRLPRGYELLVPEALWRELDASQRRAILRHELAHYLRGDVWKSLGVRLLALPHWFNPMSWHAARGFDEAAEWACDRAATADLPATTYAKALLRLGCTSSQTPIYGSAVRGRALAARIRRLLKAEQREDSTMKKTILIACGLMLAGLAVVRLELVAKEPAGDDKRAVEKSTADKSAPSPADSQPQLADAEDQAADDAKKANLFSYEQHGSCIACHTVPNDAKKPAEFSLEPRSMVEEAHAAFHATKAAYEAENVTMEAVYNWSIRWMRAADSAAKDTTGKIAAAKSHLKRMQDLQKKIAALYKEGTKGGEATEMAAANYYVAEAKRHLADVEAKTAAVGPALDDRTRQSEFQQLSAQIAGQVHAVEMALRNQKLTAEKRKRLEAEQLKLQAQMDLVTRWVAQTPEKPAPAASTRMPIGTRSELIDLQIKIAELEGQLQQTLVELDAAKAKWDAANRLHKANQITDGEKLQRKADFSKLQVQSRTLQEQLILYEQKLELVKQTTATQQPAPLATPAQPTTTRVPSTPAAAPPEKTTSTVPSAKTPVTAEPVAAAIRWLTDSAKRDDDKKRSLRYDGKDFDAWIKELDDLSLERRGEAISALAAFGANGYGAEAAAEILETMRGVTIWLADLNSEHVKSVAVEAFKVIPTKDSWPLVKQAAAGDNANQRMFVTWILYYYPREETMAVVRKLITDSDERVRAFAVNAMVNLDAAAPELVDALHGLLTSEKNDVALHALMVGYAGRSAATAVGDVQKRLPESTLVAIVPDLVKLLGRGPQFEQTVRQELVNIGEPAIPALEKAMETQDAALRGKVEEIFDSIRKLPGADGPFK